MLMDAIERLFRDFNAVKVGVIGDVMLDTYIWGAVERISPEAPVPVVSLHQREQRIGGAGNVALNLQALGAQAFVISVTGADEDAQCLQRLFTNAQINATYSFESAGRITTNKTRIISRNQQMMRLDAEITTDLNEEEQQKLLQRFEQFITVEKPQVVILEDYNKGVLTREVIEKVIALCQQHQVITAVDPKRRNFFAYKGVDIFKPNLKEVKEALNILAVEPQLSSMQTIHQKLQQALQHQVSFITLSEKGVFFQNGEAAAIIPSHFRNIADVSGAGDTVIAVAALVYAVSRNIYLTAEIANIAGGLVCEVVGTAAIEKQKLLHECELLLS